MMQSFVQYTPTKVVFGKDTQKEAGKLVSELGITKVFLVYAGESNKKRKLYKINRSCPVILLIFVLS